MRPPVETKRGAPVIIAIIMAMMMGEAIVQSARISEGAGSYCHDDYWLFNQLSKGEGFHGRSGGDFIATPIEYDVNRTVGSYSDTDTILDHARRFPRPRRIGWKEYRGHRHVSDIEEGPQQGRGRCFRSSRRSWRTSKNSFRRSSTRTCTVSAPATAARKSAVCSSSCPSTPTTGTVQDSIAPTSRLRAISRRQAR